MVPGDAGCTRGSGVSELAAVKGPGWKVQLVCVGDKQAREGKTCTNYPQRPAAGQMQASEVGHKCEARTSQDPRGVRQCQ